MLTSGSASSEWPVHPETGDRRRCQSVADHGRETALGARLVQVACDVEAGQALKDHFLDGVGAAVEGSGYPGVQRTPVGRQTAHAIEEFLADDLLAAFRIGHAMHAGDGPFALGKLLLGKAIQPVQERVCLSPKHGPIGAAGERQCY